MCKTLPTLAAALTLVVCFAAHAEDVDPSVSRMRSVIDQYAEDRTTLRLTYAIPTSTARDDRLRSFYEQRLASLEAVDFDKLDQSGKVDYLLLRNDLRYALKQLAHSRRQVDEVASLLPFAGAVIDLEQARRRVETVDPEKCARTLTDITKQVAELRKSLEQKLRSGESGRKDLPSPVLANRAAGLVDELRDSLRRWNGFYSGYDPEFSWWARQPYPIADQELADYAIFLRRRLAGYDEPQPQGETAARVPGDGEPQQGEDGSDQPGPAGEWHAHQSHALAAQVHRSGDEVDRPHQRGAAEYRDTGYP